MAKKYLKLMINKRQLICTVAKYIEEIEWTQKIATRVSPKRAILRKG